MWPFRNNSKIAIELGQELSEFLDIKTLRLPLNQIRQSTQEDLPLEKANLLIAEICHLRLSILLSLVFGALGSKKDMAENAYSAVLAKAVSTGSDLRFDPKWLSDQSYDQLRLKSTNTEEWVGLLSELFSTRVCNIVPALHATKINEIASKDTQIILVMVQRILVNKGLM